MQVKDKNLLDIAIKTFSLFLILLFSSSSLAPLEPRGLIMIFNGLLIMLIVVTCIKTGMHMGLNK